jgi:hypothetical protein
MHHNSAKLYALANRTIRAPYSLNNNGILKKLEKISIFFLKKMSLAETVVRKNLPHWGGGPFCQP